MNLADAIKRIDKAHGKIESDESVLERLNHLMEPEKIVVDSVERECELMWDAHHEDEMNRFFNENGIHTTELKRFFIEKK